jgi:endonuclease YncB( thermonuclease family)
VVRAALLLALAAAVVASSCEDDAGPTSSGNPARVIEVFDGDSFAIEGDEVRLLGINAPERDECFADQARERLAGLVEGPTLSITGSGERDQFGRLLVYATVDGLDVNETMLDDGMAIVVQSDHDRNRQYVGAAADAASRGVGLWSVSACGPATGAAVAIGAIEHDPPGPDGDVLDGEYVEIVNEGDRPIDLNGWVLRDESSSNRLILSTVLGDRLIVRTGCGRDDASTVHWCSDLPVWSNGGDTVLLLEANGNVAAWKTYP